MDLWIRSQSRTLLEKANSIKIAHYTQNQKVSNSIVVNNDYVFGEYETQERALEVLDEISKILNPQKIINTFNIEKADMLNGSQYRIIEKGISDFSIIQYNTYVYEMPLE